MPTPSKPVTVLISEGKSHRTKKELQQRKDGEDSLATGVSLRMRSEVKANPIAKKEFTRVSSLLKKIGKNDALVEGGINRYCSLTAEIREFEDKREVFYKNIQDLQSAYDEDKENHSIDDRVIPALDYFKTLAQMESAVMCLEERSPSTLTSRVVSVAVRVNFFSINKTYLSKILNLFVSGGNADIRGNAFLKNHKEAFSIHSHGFGGVYRNCETGKQICCIRNTFFKVYSAVTRVANTALYRPNVKMLRWVILNYSIDRLLIQSIACFVYGAQLIFAAHNADRRFYDG